VNCTVCGKTCLWSFLHLVWEVSDLDEFGNVTGTTLVGAADLCGSCRVLFNTIFLDPEHNPSETMFLRSAKPDNSGPVEGPYEEDGSPPARVSDARESGDYNNV
jgi:hypothetical protein